MRVRLRSVFVVLLVTGVAGAAYLASKPTTGNGGPPVLSDVAAPTLPSLQLGGPVSAGEAPKPTTIESKPQSTPVPGRKLATEFGSATDFRRFALSAAQHPEIGGISYALYASSICRALGNILPAYGLEKIDTIPYRANEDTSAYTARVKSLELARRNCASFSSSELSGAEEIRQADLAKTQGDIIFAMKDRLNEARKSSDAGAKSRAIAEILSSKDPLLLSDTLQRMMLDRNDASPLNH